MTESTEQHSPPSPNTSNYIGRFAPSPTGPLHMGSLIAALASYLDARSRDGVWLVRMEDLDPPRESKAAADEILFALEALGLHWDAKVLYQGQRYEAYRAAIADLQSRDLVFACDCTRQDVQESGGVYPGTCRSRNLDPGKETALRCRVNENEIHFMDRLQGDQCQQLAKEVGDFVIRRKDGLFAYQLAVVVDDAFQNITDIVRGIDLMDSTPRQIHLQQLLGMPQPVYAHIPVIVNDLGQKLSKQHRARAIDTSRPVPLLLAGLTYLQQAPDPDLADATPEDILKWGCRHWNPAPLSSLQEIRQHQGASIG